MGFVSRISLKIGKGDSTRFECKSCGKPYELDRQRCPDCGGHCIGYRESWLQQELGPQASQGRSY